MSNARNKFQIKRMLDFPMTVSSCQDTQTEQYEITYIPAKVNGLLGAIDINEGISND